MIQICDRDIFVYFPSSVLILCHFSDAGILFLPDVLLIDSDLFSMQISCYLSLNNHLLQ